MALGRRCDIGCETWPDEQLYATCPRCGEKTKRFSNLEPLSDDEARSILLHVQFDKFYERYCAQKGQPSEGPLPMAALEP